VGEADCLVGERSGRDEEAAGSIVRRHHAVQLADGLHSDGVGTPMLALHEKPLGVFAQHKVHATVHPVATALDDPKILAPKGFAHQSLEVLPRHVGDTIARPTCRDTVKQPNPRSTAPR